MVEFDKGTETILTNDETINLSEEQTELGKAGKGRAASDKDKSGETRDVRRKKEDALEGKDESHTKSHGQDSDEAGHGHGADEDTGSHTQQSLQSGQTTVQFSSGANASFAGSLTSLLGLFASSAALVRAEVGLSGILANQAAILAFRPIVHTTSSQSAFTFGEGSKGLGIVNLISAQAAETSTNKLSFETEVLQTTHSSTVSQDLGLTIINTTVTTDTGADTGADPNVIPFIEEVGFTYIPDTGSLFFFSQNIPFVFASPSLNAGEVNIYFTGAGLLPLSNYTYTILNPLQTIIPPSPNTPPGLPAINITPNTLAINGEGGYGNLLANVQDTMVPTPLPTGSSIPSGITFTQEGDLLINVSTAMVSNPMSVLVNAVPFGSNPGTVGLTFRVDASPVNPITNPGSIITTPNNPNTVTYTMSGLPQDPTSQAFATVGTLFTASGADTIVGNSTAFALNVPNAASIVANNLTLQTGTPVSDLARDTLDNFVYTYGLVPGTAVTVGEFTMSPDYNFPSSTIYRHYLIGTNTPPTEAAYGNFSEFDNTNIGGVISYSTIQELDGQTYTLTFGGNVLDVYGTKYGEGDVLVINLPTGTQANSPNNNIFNMGGNTLAGFGTSYGDMQTLIINADPGNGPTTVAGTDFYFKGNLIAVDVNIGSLIYPSLETLDMELSPQVSPFTPVLGTPSNVQLYFQDTLIEGRDIQAATGGSTYNSEIQYLSNVAGLNPYMGFVEPVTDTSSTGIEKITTTDGDNNSIIWSNDIYTTENVPNANNTTPLMMNQGAQNTYNITLLGNTATTTYGEGVPIAEGNNLYLGVNPQIDKINIQITPDIFRALDGADGQGYDKVITPADLNTAVTFTPLTNASLGMIDPFFATYLSQIAPTTAVNGTTITFDGPNGGSLSFIESVPLAVSNNPLVGGFNDFTNINIEPNLGTAAIFAYVLNQITATFQSALAPNEMPPFLYGNTVSTPVSGFNPTTSSTTPYYNELDNFFGNSLLATYKIMGATSSTITLPSGISDIEYNAAPGVTIDEFGTITVSTTTPIFANLTIQATDQNLNMIPTTQFFGFLDAPIVPAAASATTYAKQISGSETNIITGALNSTIIGVGPNANLPVTAIGNTYTNPNDSFGSNLIVDTAGGALVYGDFVGVTLSGQGTGGITLNDSSPPPPPPGMITNSIFNFNANAFDVTNGTIFGVDQSMSITAQGGSKDFVDVDTSNSTTLSLTDTGQFDHNAVIFGTQTIYGYSNEALNTNTTINSAIWGDGQTLNFSASAGTGGDIHIVSNSSNTPPAATLDVSSQIEHNTFTFNPVHVIVQGDTATSTTTVYPYIQNLLIGVEQSFSKITAANESFSTSATFSNNSFVFDNETTDNPTVIGGLGNLTVYADINLIPTTQFPSPIAGNTYDGFINPIQVTSAGGDIVTTTTDGYNNSITWGNEVFTGGQGVNTYNFTLLQNVAGTMIQNPSYNANGPYPNTIPILDSYAVFTGNDTITKFNMTPTSADVLTFNIPQPLYTEILAAAQAAININNDPNLSASVVTPADLDLIAIFSNSGGNTTISFNAPAGGVNGMLTIDSDTLTSFTSFASSYPGSLVINEINIPYDTPRLIAASATNVFDPVFINLPNPTGQPYAFAGLVTNTNPANLTYTITGLPTGMTSESNGTVLINVSGPVDAAVTVNMTDGITNLVPLTPQVHIFAINAPYIDYDTDTTVSGSMNSGAYEEVVNTAFPNEGTAVYAGGNQNLPLTGTVTYDSNLIYDTNTAVDHTIVGDVPSMLHEQDAPLTGQTFTFNSNLMNIAIGPHNTDAIYGTTESISIDAPTSVNNSVDSNIVTFGTVPASLLMNNVPTGAFPGNTIYAMGNVYGDAQTLTLATSSTEQGSITGNQFFFGSNNLTSAVYLYGSNILTGETGSTNLYAGIGALDLGLTLPNTAFTSSTQIANNSLTFNNSILTTGSGPTNFYTDIADVSQSSFALPVAVSMTTSGQVMVTDQVVVTDVPGNPVTYTDNNITFGNDTFNGNNTGTNTYNLNFLIDSSNNNAILEGNLTIENYTSNDTITINLVASLYQSMEQADNRMLQITSLTQLPGIQPVANTDFTFDNGVGGSITGIPATPLISTAVGFEYFAEPITTNAAPTLPLIFNNTSTYYSVFDPYFNNIDLTNNQSTYTITSAIPNVSLPASIDLTFDQKVQSSADTTTGLNAGVPIVDAGPNADTLTPILSLVNVALNDVNFPTNTPSITTLVGVFNGTTAPTPTGPPIIIGYQSASLVDTVGEQFKESTDYDLLGNKGNAPGDQTTLLVEPTSSDTNTQTIFEGGNNLFIDTSGGTTAFGDYDNVQFTYELSGGIANMLTISNQTYDFNQNAFDIDGVVYGIANTFQINVTGGTGVIDSGAGDKSAITQVSSNTYMFGSQTIFGSGTLIGDIASISIDLLGGQSNSTQHTGTITTQANFTSNTFDFGSNLIDAIGPATTNTLYANVQLLLLSELAGTGNTGNVDASVSFTGNTFNFSNSYSILIGGSGTNDFYGHLSSFGNSDNPALYGFTNFYTGVSVNSADLTAATPIVSIRDSNGNIITWGNDIYTSGPGTNNYNYTLVGTNATIPVAVGQGFDIINNFDWSPPTPQTPDQLAFLVAYPLYAALDTAATGTQTGPVPLTLPEFEAGLSLAPSNGNAVISFPGGGSITLEGLGSAVTLLSQLNITFQLADPITAVSSPTSNVLAFGNTIVVGDATDVNSWNQFFNTGHDLSATIAGISITNGIIDYTNVPATDSNTGIIATSVSNITAFDDATTLTSQNTSPIEILALSGATVIGQSTGEEQGGQETDIIVGYGNEIIGGGQDIDYTLVVDNGTAATYGQKLIYDVASQANPVVGDIQNLTYDPISTTTSGDTVNLNNIDVTFGNSVTSGTTTIYQNNFIEIVPSTSNTDLSNQTVVGDVGTINFTVTGAENTAITSSITNEIISNNIIAGNNTIISPGTIYGDAQSITLNVIDGFAPTMTGSNLAEINANNFTFGNEDLTGSGTGSTLYGDAQSLTLLISPPTTTNEVSGDGSIEFNLFAFGSNNLIGSIDGGNLYAGVATLETLVNDEGLTNQPTHSDIGENVFLFGDSTLTAMGGVTNFYGDIYTITKTDFYTDTQGLNTLFLSNHLIVTDAAGNGITFGNDTFIGSTVSTTTNNFNIDLLYSSLGGIIAPGNTTIENFGTPSALNNNVLDLHISQALYTVIDTLYPGQPNAPPDTLTATQLDDYYSHHNNSVVFMTGQNMNPNTDPLGDTVINFSGNYMNSSDPAGSITLTDTNISSFSAFGTNLEITVGDPTTTISSTPGSSDVFNVGVPGNTLSSYSQTTNVENLDSLGHIVDFSGTVNLSMSTALYQALGLSDSNTTAQNMQVLQNDVNSSAGGIAVTTTTSGTGANAITNTVMTLESIHNGIVTTFGSIVMADTHFNPLNPLVNHLNITHH